MNARKGRYEAYDNRPQPDPYHGFGHTASCLEYIIETQRGEGSVLFSYPFSVYGIFQLHFTDLSGKQDQRERVDHRSAIVNNAFFLSDIPMPHL
jgi:hypothetical protein